MLVNLFVCLFVCLFDRLFSWQEDHFDGDLQVKPADDEASEYVAFHTIGAAGEAAPESGEGEGHDAAAAGEESEPQWYYLHDGHTQGPVPTSHLAHWVDNGHFTLDLMVKSADDPNAEFVPLRSVAPEES